MERVVICSGDHVSLAVLVREDAPVLYRIINEPEVHRFLSSPSRIYSLVDEYEWIDNSANVYEKSVNFAIIENKTKEVAGIIGIGLSFRGEKSWKLIMLALGAYGGFVITAYILVRFHFTGLPTILMFAIGAVIGAVAFKFLAEIAICASIAFTVFIGLNYVSGAGG